MRPSGLGKILLGAGLVVGVVAGVALSLGLEPSKLPPALLDIAAYKLTFLAAAGLLAAGAIVLRYGRREARDDDQTIRAAEVAGVNSANALPPMAAEERAPGTAAKSRVELPRDR